MFAVSAMADTMEEAVQAAYNGVARISFQNMYFRDDIAQKILDNSIMG